MYLSRITAVAIILGVAVLTPAASRAADDEKPWSVELGTRVGYHSNLFFERNDTKDDNSLELYGRGAYELDLGPAGLELSLAGNGIFFRDVKDSNYQTGELRARYKQGRTRVAASYSRMQNRLFSEDGNLGNPVFFDVEAAGLELRQGLWPGCWVEAAVEVEQWEFDSSESERDARLTEGEGALRIPVSDGLAFRLGALYVSKNAKADRYDWSGPGAFVAIEARPAKRVDLFVRYKRRLREYDGAAPGDSNFEREDRIDDVVADLRWRVRDRWGVQLRTFYRWGDSTRRDRNYRAGSVSAGFFVSY